MNESAPEAALQPTAPVPAEKRRGLIARLGLNFLTISILAHVLFGIAATYFIVQTISAKRKLTFAGGPPSPNPSTRAMEHKVQMAKKQNTMSAPVSAKRITTTGLSKIALPPMPAMPKLDAAVTPAHMSGMSGTMGLGFGSVGGGGAGGGTGGGGFNMFGMRDTGGGGLEGTFYDFTKEANGKTPVPGINMGVYRKIVGDFTKGNWTIDPNTRYYKSPSKLYSKFFLFPAIISQEAGAAFHSPTSPNGNWIAHYKGNFAAPADGRYRFVGFGDNAMMVRVDGRLELDASDHGDTGMKRERVGDISFPKKGATPLFFGNWMHWDAGRKLPIEIVVGDEGGIFCAGLFIQKEGVPYKAGAHGVPELPLFTVGAITDAEKENLRRYVPDVCLTGPVFSVPRSIFDH